MNCWICASLALALGTGTALAADLEQVDCAAFMSRHDVNWTALPTKWSEGAFLGNGQLGLMIYHPAQRPNENFFGFMHRPEEENSLRFEVGRSDVVDHRPGRRVLVDQARLPIGRLLLHPVGKITGGEMRLDLWEAEARGVVHTDRGSIRWRAVIPSGADVFLIEHEPSEGEAGCRVEFFDDVSESSRLYKWNTDGQGRARSQDNYPANPQAERSQQDGFEIVRQPMLAGGDYATVWRSMVADGKRTIVAAVGYDREQSGVPEATAAIERGLRTGVEPMIRRHRNWWHDYYRQSFLSIPDSRLESAYWLQMYKLGAATRADKPALDLMGPWYRPTIWPGRWWNLNLQLSYYPVYVANRLHIGESLPNLIDANVDELIANAPTGKRDKAPYEGVDFDAFSGQMAMVARATASDDNLAGGMFKGQRGSNEYGNLPWALHNYWRHCRYSGDDKRLRDRLLPLLRLSMNLYRALLEQDKNGVYHLRSTYSPEVSYGPDCNFDLALLRWGLRTLIAESARLGVDDPLLPTWREIEANLTDYPADKNGFMIARDAPFKGGHRHYSHLLMVYPLRLIRHDQPKWRSLIETSVEHWAGGRSAFAGYSYTGAAAMYASMGSGDRAATYLNEFIDRQMTPNTMYLEAESPVIESPLSLAESVHDMLLTCDNDWLPEAKPMPRLRSTIRVLPAVPKAWANVVFHNLRTEGAFLISAKRMDAANQWVAVRSTIGGTCRIAPNLAGHVEAAGLNQSAKLIPVGNGVYEFETQPGEVVFLYAGEQPESPVIRAVTGQPKSFNWFGSTAMAAKKKK